MSLPKDYTETLGRIQEIIMDSSDWTSWEGGKEVLIETIFEILEGGKIDPTDAKFVELLHEEILNDEFTSIAEIRMLKEVFPTLTITI